MSVFSSAPSMSKGDAPEPYGLEEVFRATFPIESPNGDMLLEYEHYTLDESAMKYSEYDCKQKGLTYAVPSRRA
jgi:DNA-directed RNA polymerase subunit beta